MQRFCNGLLGITLMIMLSACSWGHYYVLDLDDLPPAIDSTMFRITGTRTTDLSGGMPSDCYLPGGTPFNEWNDGNPEGDPQLRRASGVSAAGMMQAILDKMNSSSVIEMNGIYTSIDSHGNPLTLSGKVLLPADGKFDRYIIVSHYTIGSNKEAPSNAFPLEGMLCSMGYALVVPDYIGYGVTANMQHPYLVMNLTAMNVVDMYVAVKKYFDAAGIRPKYDDIYLMGYSQGGATTMAVEYMIEEFYNP